MKIKMRIPKIEEPVTFAGWEGCPRVGEWVRLIIAAVPIQYVVFDVCWQDGIPTLDLVEDRDE